MPKNIAIFSDGTSHTKSTLTNVRQFYDVLVKNKDNKCFYDKGVGSFSLDILGKAFGTGIKRGELLFRSGEPFAGAGTFPSVLSSRAANRASRQAYEGTRPGLRVN